MIYTNISGMSLLERQYALTEEKGKECCKAIWLLCQEQESCQDSQQALKAFQLSREACRRTVAKRDGAKERR